jgi:hypothetical protein
MKGVEGAGKVETAAISREPVCIRMIAMTGSGVHSKL